MLDETDQLILHTLKINSRITMKELSEIIHLTPPATKSRVEKLEDLGVIKGYTIKTDDEKLGQPIHTFITPFTRDINHKPYLSLINQYKQQVKHHYKVSGEGCYIIEAKFTSHKELNDFLEALNIYANYKLSIIIEEKSRH